MNVKDFLDRFCEWARAQPDIEAVALVGSWACDAASEDSDVDLIILTTKTTGYLRDQSWPSVFGEVTECKVEDWGRCKSLRVFYKDNLEVEYGFALPEWADIPVDPGTHRVVINGMKILFDPKGVLAKLQKEVFATLRLGER